jgi:signal transduction histidine kinase
MRDIETLSIAFHLLRVGMFFIAPALILFSLLITRTHNRWFNYFFVLSFSTSLSISILNNSFFPSTLELSSWGYLPEPDIIYSIHRINFILSVAVSILVCGLAYRRTIFTEKQRIAWIMVAYFVGAPFGILAFNFSKISGTVGAISFLSILAYAVFRYRLTSTPVVISRFLSKGLSSLALIMGYILINEFITQSEIIREEQYIYVNALYMLICFSMYSKLATGLQTYADPLLIDHYYDLEDEKKQIISNLSHCLDGKELKAVLDDIFYRLIRVKDYKVYLRDAQQNAFNTFDLDNGLIDQKVQEQAFMQCEELTFYEEVAPQKKHHFARLEQSAFIPICGQGGVIAMITLGQPNKKEQYALRDIQLLSWLSEQLGETIQVILEYSRCINELDAARKKTQMVEQFNTYNHDLKGSLNNISALVNSGDLFPAEERNQMILEQTQSGLNRVITMCNILSDRDHQEKQSINLNQSIQNVYHLFKISVGKVDFKLGNIPQLFARQDMIEILLSNLFKNAIEACTERVDLKIKTSYDKDNIVFVFTDNGEGMPPERVDKLFSQTTTTKKGGSGVGMSVIKNIVRELNGNISVDSVVNQGTTFTFSIPPLMQVINQPKTADSVSFNSTVN